MGEESILVVAIERRITELEQELDKANKMAVHHEAQLSEMRTVGLRISGAIQGLRELLGPPGLETETPKPETD